MESSPLQRIVEALQRDQAAIDENLAEWELKPKFSLR
jgi:hypothetical protein